MNDSLESVCDNYVLYILAMDDLCFDVLVKLHNKNIVPIALKDFLEFEELSTLYEERPRVEFLWTCSCHLIDYVLQKLCEKWCTYIDADLFFYSDPSVLLAEMGEKTVQVIEHRFSNSHDDKILLEHSGPYCVEFNTFKYEERSLKLLAWWKEQCRVSCSAIASDKVFGDQKYLTGWEKYSFVSVVNNLGGGIAPWNINQYVLLNDKDFLMGKRFKKASFKPVFYHFHNLSYINTDTVNINVFKRHWINDKRLIEKFYLPYLLLLNNKKNYLKEEFGFYPLITVHPAFKQAQKEQRKMRSSFTTKIKKIISLKTFIIFQNRIYKTIGNLRRRLLGKKDIIKIYKDFD